MKLIVPVAGMVAVLIFASSSAAEPLGTSQVIEASNVKFIGEFGSDLWSSPLRDKRSPIRIYRMKMRVPVKKDEKEMASVHAEADGLSLGRADITLGKHQVYLGSDFRDQKMGFGFDRRFEGGSSFTLFGAYASASDQPFEGGRDSWLEGMAIYRRPMIDGKQWIFAMDHTKNRGYLNGVAVPYVGMLFELSEFSRLTIGFLFFRYDWVTSTEWKSSFIVTPVTARLSMGKTIGERFAWEINSAFSVRSYLHANRVEDEQRIFSEHKFLETGFRTDLSEVTSIRFFIGGSFDRRIYEAKSLFRNEQNSVHLPSDLYGRLGVELRL